MHLVVDISAHGYGHAAMTAPVIDAIARRVPEVKLTVRCAAPREVLSARLACGFDHLPRALDFGMIMTSALDVDVPASAARYAELHRGWDLRVEAEAEALAALAPDLVLANVPYLSLAAAHRAGVPCVALSCLNWAEIYAYCCGDAPGAEVIVAAMREAYDRGPFLQAEPCMPMERLANAVPIGPIATLGRDRRAEIAAQLGLGEGERLVTIALGGIPTRLPMEAWPAIAGVRWLVPDAWGVRRDDTAAFEPLGIPFRDVLCSSDALVAKPGYGTFTEAACNGVRVLYLPRPGWPEAPALVRWLEANARCLEIDRGRLERGDVADALARLFALPEVPRPRPTGAEDAAAILEPMLRRGRRDRRDQRDRAR